MKKKLVLIGLALLICSGLMFGAKQLQNKAVSSNNNQIQSQQVKNEPKKAKNELSEEQKVPSVKKTEEIKQKQVVKKETNKKTNSTNIKDDPKPKILTKARKEETKVVKTQVNNEEETIKFVNGISGKIILSTKVNGEGKTVGDITTLALDKSGIEYKAEGSSSTIYFSMIDGLSERDEGPLSGWCYYVNGKKIGVGAGGYKLKAKDEVLWKYLKNGVNN